LPYEDNREHYTARTGWAETSVSRSFTVADLDCQLGFLDGNITASKLPLTGVRRAEEEVVYLEHPKGSASCWANGMADLETGPMQHPVGQGAMSRFTFGHSRLP